MPTSRQAVVASLSSADWLVRRRALQVIGQALTEQRATLFTWPDILTITNFDGESYEFVKAASTLIRIDPQGFSGGLHSSSDYRLVLLFCAAGRSGTTAPEVIKILKAEASRPLDSDQAPLAARLALAKLSGVNERDVAFIRQHFSESTSRSDQFVEMMLSIGFDAAWASGLKSGFELVLKKQSDGSPPAAILAANWGQQAPSTLPTLISNAANAARATGQAPALLVYEFAKAKMAQQGSAWISRSLVRLVGGQPIGFDHTVTSALLLISSCLLSHPEVDQLIKLLDSDDPPVLIGSARLCWAVGLPAMGAQDRLVWLVEHSVDSRVRAAAAQCLGTVGSDECIPALRRVAPAERDGSVREAITDSMKLILTTSP
jgi:hypothetical protein